MMKTILFLLLTLPALLIAQEWTMLVYIAADNDLAQWADSDLVEMEQYGSDANISVVVQIDKPSIGAQRLLVGQGSSLPIQDLGITDMCSWETLSDFLAWGISSFPADNYLVILWDHGTGWTAMPNRSFGTDWSSGNVLSIANGDFRKALATAYEYTDQRIDLFVFDACLMQQIEVAFELRPYARVLLAPQSVMPLAGLRYDEILQDLHANPTIAATDIAHAIIRSTVDNYRDVQPVAISAINLQGINDIRKYLARLAQRFMLIPPNQALKDLRSTIQTIPAIGCIPDSTDDFVDLGDFLFGIDELIAPPETSDLFRAYDRTIMFNDHWGEAFSNTTGLTVWFPDEYRQFKQLLNYYRPLGWNVSRWLELLNWLYDCDDIKPAAVALTANNTSNNELRLTWTEAFDLSPVRYHIYDAVDTVSILHDPCEDSSHWDLNGFSLSEMNYHGGSRSFFSGNASNLQNYMETQNTILVEDLGLLSIFLHYNTEDINDSLIIQHGQFRDVHYGTSNGWVERRVLLPPGDHPLRISYHTNSTLNMGGCYIDDISLYEMINGQLVRADYPDTTLFIYNELRGNHLYAVYAEDNYANNGNLSNLTNVLVEEYAVPYSIPNPFQISCTIMLDYPDTLDPVVEIYSLGGVLVKRFSANQITNKRVFWDGRNEDERDVASGLYFVIVKENGFKKIGKIARQR
jgi:hypothetical protein